LHTLDIDRRYRFRAEFVRYGGKPGWKGATVTVLVRRVRLADTGNTVAAHLWLNCTKGFDALGDLAYGDRIEFDARVVRREAGYRGRDFLRRAENPHKTVWTLTHPSRVRRVGHPDERPGTRPPGGKARPATPETKATRSEGNA
jgi:hypothetical protein